MTVPCRLLAMMMGFCKSLSKTIITLVTEICDITVAKRVFV